jgi:hypothetical protein
LYVFHVIAKAQTWLIKSVLCYIFTALATLSGQREIKTFYREYVQYLRENGRSEDARINPEAVACQTLESALSIYTNDFSNWYRALPDLRNGRGHEVLFTRQGIGKVE